MSAMTMSPARVSAGGRTSGSFGRRERHRQAGLDRVADRLRRIGRQAGRQIDRDHRDARRVDVGDDAFDQAGERRVEAGAEDRVHDQRAVADFGKVQLPRLAVGDLDDGQAEAAEDLEVDPRVAADLGDAADEEHRDVDAALQERARDDEAVAAVVAAAAEHGDLPLAEVACIASIAATTWRPAFSMSTSDGMPISSIVRRSASRICAEFRTRTGGCLDGGSAARRGARVPQCHGPVHGEGPGIRNGYRVPRAWLARGCSVASSHTCPSVSNDITRVPYLRPLRPYVG